MIAATLLFSAVAFDTEGFDANRHVDAYRSRVLPSASVVVEPVFESCSSTEGSDLILDDACVDGNMVWAIKLMGQLQEMSPADQQMTHVQLMHFLKGYAGMAGHKLKSGNDVSFVRDFSSHLQGELLKAKLRLLGR